ncbi:MAG: 50S ribosomal protein L2 [Chitinophagales bacterium]|jgi:large subunit ribosomal protein L2|nr:50S ribosomal protein L2 [Chitinophagales bacterium]HNI44130.1 50S ribosomal protein L2 [Chitinophagales bacterium]
MAIRKFRPVTPGTRHKIGNSFSQITTDTPEKSLLAKGGSTGGRNSSGRRATRNRGGGHKQRYRIIDFKRNKHNIPGTVKTIEYDPNRSAFIALIAYADGEKRYIIAPEGLKVGMKVLSGENISPDLGNSLPLRDMPLGTMLHNIELHPGKGGCFARSAGTYAQLAAKDGKYAVLRMPSGESRMVLMTCMATVGVVSNSDHSLEVSGKAGRSRWLGRRPRVRGVVMNPVDHPMGGGEGRASGGHPRSRTGVYAKGQKTRNVHKPSSRLIISKAKGGKK